MKKLIAFIAAACMALTANAAPKKEDKAKDKKKETPAMMWDVVIEGTFTDNSEAEIKAMLADVKGLKVDSIAKTEKTVDAVVSSTQRFSRSDISRALAKNKSYKVKEFKTKKPEKAGDKKEEPKKEEPKKEEPKKEEPKKEEAPKKEAPKTETPKAEAPKADAPATEAPKK